MAGGERGPVRDIVLLNAAAALLADTAPILAGDVTDQVAEQLQRADASIDRCCRNDTADVGGRDPARCRGRIATDTAPARIRA